MRRLNKVKEKHWSNIKQDVGRKPITFAAFRRKIFKSCKFGIILALIAGFFTFLVSGFYYVRGHPIDVNLSGPVEPIQSIRFHSDGVLSPEWLKNVHGIQRGDSLMDVDIFSLKRKLESFGQVDQVEVQRHFPSTLKVTIKELEPVMRVRLSRGSGFQDLLIASEGQIFNGFDYPKSFLSKLPFLATDSLVKEGNQYQNIKEIQQIYPLIEHAKRNYSKIYSTWRVISYKNLAETDLGIGAFVYVRSSIVDKIIFRPLDYKVQMSRLSVALKTTIESGINYLGVVDLSLKNTAILELASR